jgi:hypothetical protein
MYSVPSWRVHKVVLSQALHEVSGELGSLRREFVEGLFRGVVEPDEVPDKAVRSRVRVARGGVRVYSYEGYAKHHAVDNALVKYYYNLALYYARRENQFLSGVALGRAIHYAQDGSIKTRRLLVLDVHDRVERGVEEAVKSIGRDVWRLCRDVKLSKEASTQGLEALCIAFRKTCELLKNFHTELAKPVDVKRLRKRVWAIRFTKAAIATAAILIALAIESILVLALAIIISIGIAYYRPKTYYEAMKAGLMILKPYSYKPAY